jgi:hypothetical protein
MTDLNQDLSVTPVSHFQGQGLSPISAFFDFESFDARHWFEFPTKLPWFRLLSILDNTGLATLPLPAKLVCGH